MKKITALLLCLVLAFSSMTVSVSAESANETASVGFTVSSAFARNGETAKVFIDIAENSMMSAAVFKLKFDTSMLEAQSIEIGTVLQNGYSSKNITSDGAVMVSYAHTSPTYTGGRLFEVELKAVGSPDESELFAEIPVELEVMELKGFDYVDITPVVQNGLFEVVNTLYGDVNTDELVAPSDTLLILNYAVGLAELSDLQKQHADVTGDGKINSVDAMNILRYTAGVISTYPVFELESPTGLAVTSKDETYVELSWESVDFTVGYNLYMNGEKVNDELITDTSYTVSSLEQDTKYRFCVTAENTLKESVESTAIEVSTNKADRTVIFKDYDGTVLNTQIVLSGESAEAPEEPVRTGYTFTGWNSALDNITADTVITAQYSINSYTVSFNSVGGTEVSAQTKDFGELLDRPDPPVKTDYTFMGWYTDSAYVNEWHFDTDTVSKNMTLYAKWETWSAWSTSLPDSVTEDDYIIESREETRYRTKSTKSSSSSSLSGWTLSSSAITSWTSWSSWQNTAVSATASRQVQTQWIAPTYKTVWHYNRSTNGSSSTYALGYYGAYSNQYITLDYQLSCLGYVDGYPHYGPYVGEYGTYLKNYWWNESSSQQVVTAGYTQYRYRTAVYTYYYYKWSDWSDWSTNSKTADDTTQVQTRTVYRYIPIQK